MTLQEFLAALQNPNAVVTINEAGETPHELIKMYAAGYEQLLTDLLAKEVETVTVVSPQAITVVVEATI